LFVRVIFLNDVIFKIKVRSNMNTRIKILCRFAIAVTTVISLGSLTTSAALDVLPPEGGLARLVVPSGNAKVIPGHYIVVYKDNVTPIEGNRHIDSVRGERGARIKHVYENALKGFAAQLSDASVASLRANPKVAYIEQEQEFTADDIDGVEALDIAQAGATWGLDRIDQKNLPLNSVFNYTRTGKGVNAYVIDTGILQTHIEFGGRAVKGFDAVTSGGAASDCNGHGTHVAGTIGSKTYGVAKEAKLIAVRVLDCNGSGSTSGVIAGIDWVRKNAVKPAVANMSLGGGASTALDSAVVAAINAGITFAIAGGNSNANACNYSPARVSAAITVGATTSTDTRASYSNYGSCLDIFAPGSNIKSTWNTSTTAVNTISGTSMATPHVAGAVALYLQSYPTAPPATVRNALVSAATLNKVTGAGTGSSNVLLCTNAPNTCQ
jgi:subtilisin family serine protease